MTAVISVVTPTLNQGRFLARCLASVRDQPHGVAEHIVMDGSSKDGSVALLGAGAIGAWRSSPDEGQSHAINVAFGVGGAGPPLVQAEFGTWLNADDWYQPGALGAVAAFFRDYPETDVLVCRARFVADDGHLVHAPTPPERIDEPTLLMLRSSWFAGHSMAQPEVFFRSALFRSVGGLDESNHHSMDHHLWLKFLEAGARVRQLDLHVANQGVHPGQKTADRLAATGSIVRGARAWLERRAPHWPLRAGDVREELDAIERKLRLAERYAGAIDRAMAGEGGEGVTDVQTRAPDDWRAAFGEVLDLALGATHTRAHIVAEMDAAGVIEGMLVERGVAVGPAIESSGRAGRVVVIHAMLTGCRNAGECLQKAAAGLSDGDVIVISGEVVGSAAHERYLKRLRSRVVNKVTQPDDLVVGPRADLVLRPLLEGEEASVLETHPNPMGIGIHGLLTDAAISGEVIAERAFGRMDHVPLAPFPTVPKLAPGAGESGEGSHAWRCVAVRIA